VHRKAKAFCPAGISGFFQICDKEPNGKPITDPERIGARGGGFALKKGVFTEVTVVEQEQESLNVFINGKLALEAETTRTVVDMLLERVNKPYSIAVKHDVEVPIGAGFGSSAAGALGVALALSKALNINLTYNQIGRIAHVAEVKCRTGLGTVGGLLLGGCVIIVEPGAPNYAVIDRIPISPNYQIVAGVYKPQLTSKFLKSTKKRDRINEMGQKTLDKILAEPSLESFLHACREFAEKTGLVTQRVRKLMDAAERAGCVGVAQNMLGEAVHALVEKDKVKKVVEVFERFLPPEKILVAEVSLQGAQLIT
jgi:pantoate kinase